MSSIALITLTAYGAIKATDLASKAVKNSSKQQASANTNNSNTTSKESVENNRGNLNNIVAIYRNSPSSVKPRNNSSLDLATGRNRQVAALNAA
jgi:hypothetical protein